MNSCILMAKIVRAPELRYTKENQTPVAEMLVEFDEPRPDAPPSTLRAIGWGNLASELQENYAVGDRIVLEGRLSMNSFERQEGFKEKRAELVVARVHVLNAEISGTVTSAPASEPTMTADSPTSSESPTMASSGAANVSAPASPQPAVVEPGLDDIPF